MLYHWIALIQRQNLAPLTPGRAGGSPDDRCTPPGSASSTLGLRPWQISAFASPPFRALSPNSKPALNRQRDHSACSKPDTPLKIRKTRENLRQDNLVTDVAPPCSHLVPDHHDVSGTVNYQAVRDEARAPVRTPSFHSPSSDVTIPTHLAGEYPTAPPLAPLVHGESRIQRHRSVSRRMLSKVKQGITNRSKPSPVVRPIESETSLLRRLSNRPRLSTEVERRAQSFEVSRDSIESSEDDAGDALASAYPHTERSFTNSTVSTGDFPCNAPTTPPTAAAPAPFNLNADTSALQVEGSSQGELTPRQPAKKLVAVVEDNGGKRQIETQYVHLAVSVDRLAVDASTGRNVWVCIEATVRSRTTILNDDVHAAECLNYAAIPNRIQTGSITSLRLCFKPAEGCQVVDIIGQKTAKNLHNGQSCALFIKVHVPAIKQRAAYDSDEDNGALFNELESILGTLNADLINVEARYRHSLLPHDNVIHVRQTAKIRRPRIASRWSILTTPDDMSISDEVHTKLAIHLADNYPPEKALKLIDRCIRVEATASQAVRQVRQTVLDDVNRQHAADGTDKPSVVITDVDMMDTGMPTALEKFASTSSRALSQGYADSERFKNPPLPSDVRRRSTSLSAIPTTVQESRSLAAKITSATNLSTLPETQDDARKVWHHIRHSSLSAKQAEELATQPVQQLEANDEQLKELRRRALANKRSVGAETLKDWKWSETMAQRTRKAEAPWL